MITTDRVSAFDHVLGTIPFKGEVLSRLTLFWFEKVKDIAPTHLLDAPDPSVMVVKKAKPLPIEIVIRGYITGSLWRDYQAGKAGAYGIEWPKGLRKDQRFEKAVITPSTKAEYGKHDEPISEKEILDRRIVAPEVWRAATEQPMPIMEFLIEQAAGRHDLRTVPLAFEAGGQTDDAPRLVVLHVGSECHSNMSVQVPDRRLFTAAVNPLRN